MCSRFSCVRSSHGLCARAHAHSLEGTLPTTKNARFCSVAKGMFGINSSIYITINIIGNKTVKYHENYK